MALTRIRAQQISDIDYKQAVRVITVVDVTLSGGAPSTVDGVNLSAGDRVLVTGQSTASQNGLYDVATLGTGSNGTWTRTPDGNQDGEIEAGMIVMVTEGTIYKDTQWKLTTNNPIIIGTTPLTFEQNSAYAFGNIYANGTAVLANAVGGTVTLSAGGNVTITGNNTSKTITISASGGGGSGTAITNGGSNVDIAAANANVTVSVAGTSNVAVFSTGGLSVAGNVIGNGIAITTVSNTAPANPEQGDIWIDSDTGIQYIYFTASGNSQWAEMESETSISITSLDYGNANVLAYLTTGVAGNILPSANVTYDLGSSANRWNDIWLANSTIYLGAANISASGDAVVLPANTTVGGAVVTAVPKITGFDYPGDDTAAAPAGGQTILINGANFESGCIVYIDNAVISPVGFVNSTQLSITSPAKATGTYSVYVVNPDGSTALALPGIIYSGVPDWTTAAGNIGAPYETTTFSTVLTATADSAVTYAAAPGNTLPANLSLNSSTGNLSGTVPVANVDTTYTFSVRATDAELQDTDRQFSVTYRTDVVTWESPANAASYTWPINIANSLSMTATSAANKNITFSVQSGSLPANTVISGNLITGTPNTIQSNTSVIIRATAADTARYSDRTLYFTIVSSGPTVIGEAYGGGYYGGKINISGTQYYLIVAPKDTGQNVLAVKTDTSSDSANSSAYDGFTNTDSLNDAAHPAFQWARGLTISGYTDWYIPAPYEFLILYYNLKPTTDANAVASWGYNPYSVSPYTPSDASYWKAGEPVQTSLADWQVNGAQSIANPTYANRFWSSMQVPNNAANIVRIDMRSGIGYDGVTPTYQSSPKTTALPVRAIRKILV